jgi:hypothetical protein
METEYLVNLVKVVWPMVKEMRKDQIVSANTTFILPKTTGVTAELEKYFSECPDFSFSDDDSAEDNLWSYVNNKYGELLGESREEFRNELDKKFILVKFNDYLNDRSTTSNCLNYIPLHYYVHFCSYIKIRLFFIFFKDSPNILSNKKLPYMESLVDLTTVPLLNASIPPEVLEKELINIALIRVLYDEPFKFGSRTLTVGGNSVSLCSFHYDEQNHDVQKSFQKKKSYLNLDDPGIELYRWEIKAAVHSSGFLVFIFF